jgi:hypothetical protein
MLVFVFWDILQKRTLKVDVESVWPQPKLLWIGLINSNRDTPPRQVYKFTVENPEIRESLDMPRGDKIFRIFADLFEGNLMCCWFDVDSLFIILDEGRIQFPFNFRIERVERSCREWRNCRPGIGRVDCAHVVRGKILWASRALLLLLYCCCFRVAVTFPDAIMCEPGCCGEGEGRGEGGGEGKERRMQATLSLPFAPAHRE